MAINNIATTVRNNMCNALVDAIDVGSGTSGGKIRGYTAAFASMLFECDFANPAFGNAAVGVATANAIGDETSAPASGTAAVGRVVDRDAATVFEFTIGTSGADLNLNSTSISIGAVVSITAMTVTQPAS
jgi:hypothetical protein